MSTPLLVGEGLTVAYGNVTAVDSVDISVHAGEVIGLIGPNGAGKTSLIDGISGFTRMTGRLDLDGAPLGRVPAFRRRRRGLSRTWQSVALFEDLTLLENMIVARGAGPSASDQPARSRIGAHRRDDAIAQLDLVGLSDQAGLLPGEMSHGQQVLAGVARALMGEPRVVLMDEPAAGLDDSESVAFTDLVRGVAASGVGIVVIDHDMNLIMRVCDRLHVLDFGRTVSTGDPRTVARDPKVIAAYLGGASAASHDTDAGEDDE